MGVRIKDQATDTDLAPGDYVIIDSESEGTRKYDLGSLENRVKALESAEESGLTNQEKSLILTLFSKAAYAEADAESAYDTLEGLWRVVYRTITYNLTNCISSSSVTSVENGKPYSTSLSAQSGFTITTATVTMGGTDVTASYYNNGSISIPQVTGDVVITASASKALASITATYTQSGTVYDTASLDDLKSDLVVTANYSDGTSETVTDYTLSGTLAEGTSVVTVTYAGLTDTFSVTVSEYVVSLDTVIYEDKSYRDIFMTANQLQGFDFESGLPSGMTVNAGSPTISTDDCYSTSHSMKAFGSSSAQYKSTNTTGVADWNKYAGKAYFGAFKANCTRYTKGSLGISGQSYMPSAVTAVTDGWITQHRYSTNTTGQNYGYCYVGSFSSADLDGYIDDIVWIPMTDIFTSLPTEAQMLQWYNEYCDIRKAGGV